MCMTQEKRGITLLSQVLKLLEKVLDAMIRRSVEGDFGEEQQGFGKGRGSADGMCVLRQMVDKRLEVQRSMPLRFFDPDKAFDIVPREMVMTTLRWMGVPEAEVTMVEGTYEKTKARVLVGEGVSGEFEVNIGLRQGSVLSPLLFIANLGNDRTTTKTASVRKQLGTKHSKNNKHRQEKNGGGKGRDGSAEELDTEPGEEQTTVDRTRRKDGG